MVNELFFEKYQHLLNLARAKEQDAIARGERYNIFDVLKLSTNETRLHSALLSDLLNPNGSHGLKDAPLKHFLRICAPEIQISDKNLKEATVVTEYHIGPISENYEEGGYIDILIKINHVKIVIENKIYAGDQNSQILRYYNFCKTSEHSLLYLTLNGNTPSDKSTKGLVVGKDYKCISYRNEILEWLKECLFESISKPLVRETLQQYINLIKDLTNSDMDETQRSELFSLMAQYPEVVNDICNNAWYFRQYLVTKYVVEPFIKWCGENNYYWYEDANFRSQSKAQGFGIAKPGWKKMVAVEFDQSDFRNASYGVWIWQSKQKPDGSLALGNEYNESWPYGWEYLSKYSTWGIDIAHDLVAGKVFEYVKERFIELIHTIEENPEKFNMD
ncbi:MAG: PD-(D/E)XK nuclease family protein [Muribaculaceae bacterium]|nr:PD-(D/E)XK nuclease family protein [Muribaculaceae bacterium]